VAFLYMQYLRMETVCKTQRIPVRRQRLRDSEEKVKLRGLTSLKKSCHHPSPLGGALKLGCIRTLAAFLLAFRLKLL
jgi:hypothetical protein